MYQPNFINQAYFLAVQKSRPHAYAELSGSPAYPGIRGVVKFYQTSCGVLVVSEVNGLPVTSNPCNCGIFAYHIHEGKACSGNQNDPFANTKGHYNPKNCNHPCHAGDLTPLFSNNGYAYGSILTDRFSIKDIIGRTVVIHRNIDDFTSQPAGNAGEKIACGVVRKFC